MPTWSLKRLEIGEGSPLVLSSSHPDPHFKVQEATLLRPVGRSLPDCCEAPAAALTPVVTAAAAASVAERERERQLVVVELGSAEEERQGHYQLRGCSLVCFVQPGAASESLVRWRGRRLLGRTASAASS